MTVHQIPYILNILILVPAMVFVVQGKIDVFPQRGDMEVMRMMVACLWVGVLLLSVVALFDPLRYWPLLVFQVLYNLVFGAVWVWPAIVDRQANTLSRGTVAVFVLMVVAWPFFIAAAL